jgi:hypothetical protein
LLLKFVLATENAMIWVFKKIYSGMLKLEKDVLDEVFKNKIVSLGIFSGGNQYEEKIQSHVLEKVVRAFDT